MQKYFMELNIIPEAPKLKDCKTKKPLFGIAQSGFFVDPPGFEPGLFRTKI